MLYLIESISSNFISLTLIFLVMAVLSQPLDYHFRIPWFTVQPVIILGWFEDISDHFLVLEIFK